MYKFKLGDKVVVAKDLYNDDILGLKGVVVEEADDGPGVSFINWNLGHSIHGKLKDSSGWYVTPICLQLVDDTPFEGNV